MKKRKWLVLASAIVLALVITLVVSFVTTSTGAASVLPWYAPDHGKYCFTKNLVYSWDFYWDSDANKFDWNDGYEHEFKTDDTGYAMYIGELNWTNLPWPRYCDIDEPEDEFSMGTLAATWIDPYAAYYTYIYLEPEDPNVTSADAILEAERTEFYFPKEGKTIISFTAPSTGSW